MKNFCENKGRGGRSEGFLGEKLIFVTCEPKVCQALPPGATLMGPRASGRALAAPAGAQGLGVGGGEGELWRACLLFVPAGPSIHFPFLSSPLSPSNNTPVFLLGDLPHPHSHSVSPGMYVRPGVPHLPDHRD